MDNPSSGGCSLVLVLLLGLLASALLLVALIPVGGETAVSPPTMDIIVITAADIAPAPVVATPAPTEIIIGTPADE